jgi:hypothetical protein
MLNFSCLCGRARIALDKRPDFINACNCTLCRKAGAHWGYFNPSEVQVSGETRGYSREDMAAPNVAVHFCPYCGATTHFKLTASAVSKFGNTMMGVNMLLAEETDLSGVELRFPDGQAWPGAGEFTYVRPARIIGQAEIAE